MTEDNANGNDVGAAPSQRYFVETETDEQGNAHYILKDRQTGSSVPFGGGAIQDKRRADAICEQYNNLPEVPPDQN